MSIIRKLTLAMLLSATAALSAHAEDRFVSGNMPMEQCTSSQVEKLAHCIGYVRGFADALMSAKAAGFDRLKVCVPKQATAKQIIDVVVLYGKANPKNLHESASALAAEALRDAWPCKPVP